tara:strand:+ start:166 stop:999 length:834 start_codon:yes stop_codon:yes gene_type:complete
MILSGCTSVFYQPTRFLYATPKALEITHEDVFFDSSDGKRLHGWYLHHKGAKAAKGLITLFHGNAQNLSSHFLNLAWITEHGFDVFIFDYRGYGLSIGTPTPEGVNLDAIAALEKSYDFVKTKNIPKWIVHAQSLGGLIAMRSLEDFKSNDAIDLLVLDSTFDSYDDIAFEKLTSHWLTFIFSPLGPLLVSDSMAPNIFFEKYNGNVLVMHGRQDLVIPIKFGRNVFERINGAKKLWWEIEDGKHIDTFNSAKGDSYKLRYLEMVSTINGAENQSRK